MTHTQRCILPHLIAIAFLAVAPSLFAQSACPAAPRILESTQPNIFSEQQEQWLGDAMADMLERYYKPVNDPLQNEYLARITNRLLAALPHTSIQFHVLLVDSSEINGFSLAGGRVYLTRKLVANARSEDEVASVIAHEMGHILSHQFAIQTTGDLKRLLNIDRVTDKADIYAKFQRLADARTKDKHPDPGNDTDEKQNEADTVAVYAAAAAGYRPQAYAEFWNRIFFVDGKVGGPLSDFFGNTKPEAKRLRAILKLVAALPPGCGGTQATPGTDFERWHTLVVANQPGADNLNIKPAAEVILTPPLRMDLERLRFSHDGKFVLAQDESSIYVLTREPFAPLFRFDAEKALPAEFSPDSERIVFHTAGLHTEEWSIKEQKRLSSHEPVSRNACLETRISPDGRTIVCISLHPEESDFDLSLLDSATGEIIFQKKSFFTPTIDFMSKVAMNITFSAIRAELVPASFSPDGNILLIGPSNYKLAFDLRTRSPIPLSGGIKSIITGPYAFMGNDKVVGVDALYPKDSGVFSFPDGRRLQTITLSATDLQAVSGGDYVLTHELKDYAIGLIDIHASKLAVASKAPSLDVYDGSLIDENPDGSILLHSMADQGATVNDKKATLPLSPLTSNLFAIASDDRKYLAISTRTRSGIWELATGQQVAHLRHFNSAVFAPDNTLFAEFPKLDKTDRSIAQLTLAPLSSARVPYKEEDNMGLSGGTLQEWKPLPKKAVELIIHDLHDNAILWRSTFEEGAPAHSPNLIQGQTIFSFPFETNFAKARIKAVPALASHAALVKDRDLGRVIQVLDNSTGKVLHEMVIETPARYSGVEGISVVGDLLYLSSADNRTIAYALDTGTQLRQTFGSLIAADAASGRICAINRLDEAVIYDAQGTELANFRTGSPLRFAAFQNNASQVLLLTADQKIRTFQIPNAAASTPH